MGGAQPLAVTMNGGVCLAVEVDRAARSSGASRRATSTRWRRPRRGHRPRARGRDGEGRALSIGARRQRRRRPRPSSLERGVVPDLVTDQTSRARPAERLRARTAHAYDEAARAPARPTRRGTCERALASMARARAGHARRCSDRAPSSSTTATTSAARRVKAGVDERLRLPGLRARLHPAALLRGQGPVPLGRALRRPRGHRRDRRGRPRDSSPRTRRSAAGSTWPASGCASRGCRRASAGSATASARRSGLAFNELVAQRAR